MKRLIAIVIVSMLLVVGILFIYFSRRNMKIEADFGFYIEDNSCIIITYDSRTGKYIRDYQGIKPTQEATTILSSNQIDKIFTEIREFQYFSFPDQFGNENTNFSPKGYVLLIVYNGTQQKSVKMMDGVSRPFTNELDKFWKLYHDIDEIIAKQQEVKALPMLAGCG
jgi:hypothetical protein